MIGERRDRAARGAIDDGNAAILAMDGGPGAVRTEGQGVGATAPRGTRCRRFRHSVPCRGPRGVALGHGCVPQSWSDRVKRGTPAPRGSVHPVAHQPAMMEAGDTLDRRRHFGRRHRHHLAVRGESHLGHGAYGLEHHQGIVKLRGDAPQFEREPLGDKCLVLTQQLLPARPVAVGERRLQGPHVGHIEQPLGGLGLGVGPFLFTSCQGAFCRGFLRLVDRLQPGRIG